MTLNVGIMLLLVNTLLFTPTTPDLRYTLTFWLLSGVSGIGRASKKQKASCLDARRRRGGRGVSVRFDRLPALSD